MLTITCSANYQPERKYICHVLFHEFLGLEYNLTFCEEPFWTIQGTNGKSLILPDCLFQVAQDAWLTEASFPPQPLAFWEPQRAGVDCPLVESTVPVIYGNLDFHKQYSVRYGEIDKKQTVLPLDILGSAFFMLTRYEEVIKSDRDNHDRFPATASLAFQEGFLERPIINEYLEILWFYLQQMITKQRKAREFTIVPTHDVDAPYRYRGVSMWTIGRSLAGDLIKRKSPPLFCENIRNILARKDPYDTFGTIMDISERVGLASSFYFMAGGKTPFDPAYSLDKPEIQKIIRRIDKRGHHIGFHPSYEAGLNQQIWQEELDALQRAVGDIPLVGGREHFLRFQTPLTWRFWSASELVYDTTLSFADRAGFRCGVCYPFQVFDVEQRKMLNIVERPLVMMECTVIDERYMHFGPTQEALEYMKMLKKRCSIFYGEFVLLWHNTRFVDEDEIEMYKILVADDIG
ncbi:MAG: hypothetical protein CSA26_01310 [Desulfobacterales bacterium]|nr:MAG: hypothetical protein CSA26_01310 [Desulfobacterales bacterium]